MAKIMLVEDDNNLREIYEARLLAEGYEIVSAKDGEEALALAVKEKPDLIISDVMMPKISGFDMLDILRSTAETKNTKVIMMTALSQAEDKARADKLGADRYLVKSQVTLEDVAKVARDVLNGDSPGPDGVTSASANPQPTQPVSPVADSSPTADPVSAAPEPSIPDPAQATPQEAPEAEAPELPKVEVAPEVTTPSEISGDTTSGISNDLSQTTAAEEAEVESKIDAIFAEPVPDTQAPNEPTETPAAEPEEQTQDTSQDLPTESTEQPVETIEVASAPPETVAEPAAPSVPTSIPITEHTDTPEPKADEQPTAPATPNNGVPVTTKKIIQPLNDPTTKTPDLNDLLEKEAGNTAVPPAVATSVVSPGGQTVVPANPGSEPDPKQPGNLIQPGDIAL